MSETPKTVVVDIPLGRGIDRLTYAANDWDTHDGTLVIIRDGRPVGEHAPLGWLSARRGDALAPDYAARALAAAKRALTEIANASENAEQPFGRPEIRAIAQRGLGEIFAEVEL